MQPGCRQIATAWHQAYVALREELAQIDAALGVLEGRTNAVRTYSTLGTMGEVPALAKRHGIRVTLGAWLDTDPARNEREIEQAIRLRRNTATSCASWSATRSCFAAISRAPILLRISSTCRRNPDERNAIIQHGMMMTRLTCRRATAEG